MGVELVDQDPRWAELFTQQRDRLAGLLAPWLTAPVEHIGSTSVPGLRAKPIVDLLAPVDSLAAREAMVRALAADGWLYWPDDPRADTRLWLLRPRPEQRTHHLHVVAHTHPRARALLTFRDALRADPALALRYQHLKEHLARDHPTDRSAYTNGKAPFITEVLRNAGVPTVLDDLPG